MITKHPLLDKRYGVPSDWDGNLCVICQKPITGKRLGRFVTCGFECTRERNRRREKLNRPYLDLGMGPGTVGAISELRVAVDLMQKGYAVFRALSPHCICDLAIIVGGKLFRIEVTTAYRTPNGKFNHGPKDHSKYDILAAVAHDGIQYEGLELTKGTK